MHVCVCDADGRYGDILIRVMNRTQTAFDQNDKISSHAEGGGVGVPLWVSYFCVGVLVWEYPRTTVWYSHTQVWVSYTSHYLRVHVPLSVGHPHHPPLSAEACWCA